MPSSPSDIQRNLSFFLSIFVFFSRKLDDVGWITSRHDGAKRRVNHDSARVSAGTFGDATLGNVNKEWVWVRQVSGQSVDCLSSFIAVIWRLTINLEPVVRCCVMWWKIDARSTSMVRQLGVKLSVLPQTIIRSSVSKGVVKKLEIRVPIAHTTAPGDL
ncbi:hypothetical protein TNCT_618061 [Trichonephila clavata]|uniref:Uncharacterized protein n=1 Tax=Trichonephila clavata TaxID=2740835 RepID=A0A8X6J7W0_TRICU|nr:hypothetical protein TNCT_618061 [Trichonephila clavata]